MKKPPEPIEEKSRDLAISTTARDDVAVLLGRILARHWLRKRRESHEERSSLVDQDILDLGEDAKAQS